MKPSFKLGLLILLIALGAVSVSSCSRIQKLLNSKSFREALFSGSGNSETPSSPEAIPVYTYKIVNTYPHDPEAFTQGLVFEDGVLYESTGPHNPDAYGLQLAFDDWVRTKSLQRTGGSSLRKVEVETGAVLQIQELPAEFFGEGIAIFGDRIVQLTWKSRVGFVYNKETFDLQREFSYSTEGWGITHDGARLLMSDGTSTLYIRDPETFEETGRIEVKANDRPVSNLNELEYINGEIYANVWKTDRIARISPETGHVTGWIELEGLLTPQERRQTHVLNGIAYDAEKDRLFVTGKWWPKLFEIELIAKE